VPTEFLPKLPEITAHLRSSKITKQSAVAEEQLDSLEDKLLQTKVVQAVVAGDTQETVLHQVRAKQVYNSQQQVFPALVTLAV